MLSVNVIHDQVRVGPHFEVSFQRTLRIPDDGHTYPLPPGLGRFPVRRVADFADRVPTAWRERGGVFLPMYQREAMWLSFDRPSWRPCAVKIAVGRVNAVTGEPWDERIVPGRQDYVVCPEQPWLDGINAGDGFIRQFVAMPLGMGYTVEGQVTAQEEFGGIQIAVFEPKPGLFPHRSPWGRARMRGQAWGDDMMLCCCEAPGTEMGLAAGGRMRQEIYPDPHGAQTWSQEARGRVCVNIVSSLLYREITGEAPPPSPVSARSYSQAGLPWFDLYDEGKGDIAPSVVLAGVKSVKEKDAEHGFAPLQDDAPVALPPGLVVHLSSAGDGLPVADGGW